MKKFLASKLIAVALWLNPDAKQKLAPSVEGYKAGKVGVAFAIDKNEIRSYQKENNKSHSRTVKDLIRARKAQVRIAICKKIDELIEYKTEQEGKEIIVSGHVKIYLPDGKK